VNLESGESVFTFTFGEEENAVADIPNLKNTFIFPIIPF
jgi:hypothetical protein